MGGGGHMTGGREVREIEKKRGKLRAERGGGQR